MVSKRWQRTQMFIAHLGLVLGASIPFFVLETTFSTAIKIGLIVLGYVILIPLIRYLHGRYANKFVKVFLCDYENAARIVQRALNAHRIPFTKRTGDNEIVFQIRTGKMQLEVAAFALNLMFDDNLNEQVAAMLTLQPETSENAKQMQRLRTSLDEAFAVQGW